MLTKESLEKVYPAAILFLEKVNESNDGIDPTAPELRKELGSLDQRMLSNERYGEFLDFLEHYSLITGTKVGNPKIENIGIKYILCQITPEGKLLLLG